MDENITKFIESNKALISSKVDEENGKRVKTGIPILTNDEIHESIIGMMALEIEGHDISKYEMKRPQMPNKIRQPIINPQKQAEVKQVTPQTGKTTFEIIECDNGFILNSVSVSKKQSYIFKDEKDLMKILKKLFAIKPREPKCFKTKLKSSEETNSKSLRKKRKSDTGIQ